MKPLLSGKRGATRVAGYNTVYYALTSSYGRALCDKRVIVDSRTSTNRVCEVRIADHGFLHAYGFVYMI